MAAVSAAATATRRRHGIGRGHGGAFARGQTLLGRVRHILSKNIVRKICAKCARGLLGPRADFAQNLRKICEKSNSFSGGTPP